MRRYIVKTFILFLIFVMLFTRNLVLASLPLSGKLIIVDVGHGGKDPGTMSGNVYEKDINLAISKKLEEELIKLGASVMLIRENDYDLSRPNSSRRKKSDFDNRINLINTSKADYYISIHLNYLDNPKYYGPQVFYNTKHKFNKDIAIALQDKLNKELKTNREVKLIPSSTYMYHNLEIAGVLIECGFLSNNYEKELLVKEDYQRKIAKVIAMGISELKF